LLLKFQFATSATLRQLPQTPTLIGCKFLMITRDSHLPNSAAISEALYYNTLLDDVKEIFQNPFSSRLDQRLSPSTRPPVRRRSEL
ncbi:hypothetical protein, partial [Brachymonas chironomi]|uniref:hypothetical protein n=1 Tax=Brachymonas chironomi TaxID=491919 RepID=UPI001B7FB620